MLHTLVLLCFLLFSTLILAEEKIEVPKHIIHFTGQKHFKEVVLQDALNVETKSFFPYKRISIKRRL
jgi:hypothetical protein